MAQLTPTQARNRFQERLFLTLGLGRKPLRLFCEHCGKYIPSDMPWTCGFCDMDNEKTTRFSFLYKCQRCKQPPICLQCPHCSSFLFFGKNHDAKHSARSVKSVAVPESEVQRRAQLLQSREDRKAELEHEIVVTRLDAELKMLKRAIEPKKTKSALESLEESYSDEQIQMMGVHKIVKREKEANAASYANDPELLERADQTLTGWAIKNTP